MQLHAATRRHYDFRLELDGVLRSWAVPKGPSADPKDRRLAVEVEDHPVEYADFEGLIPEGNYGAGAVIVWDRGQWTPLAEPHEGLQAGKLHFLLRGYKLFGEWILVRTQGRTQSKGKEWLLFKKTDAWARPGSAAAGAEPFPPESILSGLTLEEMSEGSRRAERIHARLVRLHAPRRPVRAKDIRPMLAEAAEAPFSRPGWIYELKYDGFRLIAAREGDDGKKPRLYYRRGNDSTAVFPEVARALGALPYGSLVLDGEVVVHDEAGRPSFQRLQKRVQLRRTIDVERAAVELPATLHVFDLLGFEEFDLRPLPLVERKAILREILPRAGPLRFADHVEGKGKELYEQVHARRLEGIVAKRANSSYRPGRSADWLKMRVERTGDFVVVGYTRPEGSRAGFGGLVLAAYEPGQLVYVGRVGTGFTDEQLTELRRRLDAIRRDDPPCTGLAPEDKKDATWVRAKLVVEVRYMAWTDDGHLRQPVFLRVRDDKRVEDCVDERRPLSAPPEAPAGRRAPLAPKGRAAERKVPFSHLEKVFWPAEGYTKGDLVEFYRAVSPWLLPLLRDRPVVLTRYPDGIDGKSFFQKDAPGFVPDWIRTRKMWSEHASREIAYFVCDDVESLLYLVNLGTIPLHVWASRVSALDRPDWCILDLDPKGAPFLDVVRIARAIRTLCDEIGLGSFVKTSGSTGLHVLLPLGGACSYEQCRTLGELLARVVVAEMPEVATIARAVAARGGRVYIDYLQNGHGKLLVSPYSVRPLPGAPVSTPLRWSEVDASLDIAAFTIRTVPERLRRLKKDPLTGLLKLAPDLPAALGRLGRRLTG